MTLRQWKRSRLMELLAHEEFGGNKAKLGRTLGYKDGSYIGQIERDDRPLGDDAIETIEAYRGGMFRGWFDRANKVLPLVQPQTEGATMITTREDADMSIEKCPLEPFVTHEQLASLSSEQLVVFAYKAKELLKEVREGWPVAASGKQREA